MAIVNDQKKSGGGGGGLLGLWPCDREMENLNQPNVVFRTHLEGSKEGDFGIIYFRERLPEELDGEILLLFWWRRCEIYLRL